MTFKRKKKDTNKSDRINRIDSDTGVRPTCAKPAHDTLLVSEHMWPNHLSITDPNAWTWVIKEFQLTRGETATELNLCMNTTKSVLCIALGFDYNSHSGFFCLPQALKINCSWWQHNLFNTDAINVKCLCRKSRTWLTSLPNHSRFFRRKKKKYTTRHISPERQWGQLHF